MTPAAAAWERIPGILRESVARWRERAAESPELLSSLKQLSQRLSDELPLVLACSEFIAAALLHDPEALAWLAQHEGPDAALAASAAYEHATAADGAAGGAADGAAGGALASLRTWRRRAMLRIAWRAIAGRASVAETLRVVSDLADACIRAAAAAAAAALTPIFGKPLGRSGDVVPLIVLGMGKLGGRELNFSSDVDLVLLFAESGQTSGRASSPTRNTFCASAGNSFACSTYEPRIPSCFASTCGCGHSATAVRSS